MRALERGGETTLPGRTHGGPEVDMGCRCSGLGAGPWPLVGLALLAASCSGGSETADGAEGAAPPTGGASGGAPLSRPNLLLVVLDDVGVWDMAAYGAVDPATTPVMNALAAEGAVFGRCWAMPVCSPARATIATGTYPFRHGIGHIVTPGLDFGLPVAGSFYVWDFLRAHAGYRTGAFGKWHMTSTDADGVGAPNDIGFEHFAGHLHNIAVGAATGYYKWNKVVNGEDLGLVTSYAVTDEVSEAIDWIGSLGADEPWFAWLGSTSAHFPLHVPPADLIDPYVPAPRGLFKAMVQAADTELGRLLDGIGPEQRARTIVILVGDNGTPPSVRPPEIPLGHAKATAFEGGVRVPLVIAGPGVPHVWVGEAALVGIVDLWATVLDLAGIQHPGGIYGIDSRSVLPLVEAASAGLPVGTGPGPWVSVKDLQYTEQWAPIGLPVPVNKDSWRRAVSNGRWKLTDHDGARALYDLGRDPTELQSAYESLLPDALAARVSLEAAMASFGGP